MLLSSNGFSYACSSCVSLDLLPQVQEAEKTIHFILHIQPQAGLQAPSVSKGSYLWNGNQSFEYCDSVISRLEYLLFFPRSFLDIIQVQKIYDFVLQSILEDDWKSSFLDIYLQMTKLSWEMSVFLLYPQKGLASLTGFQRTNLYERTLDSLLHKDRIERLKMAVGAHVSKALFKNTEEIIAVVIGTNLETI